MTVQTITLEKVGSSFSEPDAALKDLAANCYTADYQAALSSYNFTTSMSLNENVVTLVRTWDSDSYDLYIAEQASNIDTVTNNMTNAGWTIHSNTVE
jgi:hypothetical protein